MAVLNVGSLNIDHVYRVATIAQPGETVASRDYRTFAGGKGANQSVALARAGATVRHAGTIGPEGEWLKQSLAREGVDVSLIRTHDSPGGHAVIQVEDSGQNSIVIFGGANRNLDPQHLCEALNSTEPGDILLLQNEINAIDQLIRDGADAGLRVVLNPAPMGPEVSDYPLHQLTMLIVNQHGAASLVGTQDQSTDSLLTALAGTFPETDLCLTLGKDGAVLKRAGEKAIQQAAPAVDAVDTTAAGDTFIGYFLAGLARQMDDPDALRYACRAAALSVTKQGAMESIPKAEELDWNAGN